MSRSTKISKPHKDAAADTIFLILTSASLLKAEHALPWEFTTLKTHLSETLTRPNRAVQRHSISHTDSCDNSCCYQSKRGGVKPSLKHTLLSCHWYQRGKWLCWWAIQHLEEKAPGMLFWRKGNIEKPTEAQMLFF